MKGGASVTAKKALALIRRWGNLPSQIYQNGSQAGTKCADSKEKDHLNKIQSPIDVENENPIHVTKIHVVQMLRNSN